ncbi:MAG: hypothetical protein LBE38_06530 [Deltaproteobacteria bacterium]|nr:hypothetical protein [Deltaproteobacteria bacterium]
MVQSGKLLCWGLEMAQV